MLPIKRILWPTDFSEPSYEALKTAQELAEHFSAELYVLHVIAPIPMLSSAHRPDGFDVNVFHDQLKKSSYESLGKAVQNRINKGINYHQRVVMGRAPDEIVRTAQDENVDLIVIATHGETGWRHLVFGSVAEKVVRFATCPVLTIQEPEKTKG
ncbi:MAG: universal stress protein [Candidatus Aminicenantes bacterium]|nr:universal stress protein [Candidatus Aminicenantes bacterium]